MNTKPYFYLCIIFLMMLTACALLAVVSLPVSQSTPVESNEVVPPAFDYRPVVMTQIQMNYFFNEQLL